MALYDDNVNVNIHLNTSETLFMLIRNDPSV
jgi:hypothetical protein